MDSKEIDRAMRLRLPVVYGGERYDYIAEYVSWYSVDGKRRLSVGIMQGRHIRRVPAEKVEFLKENSHES